jgi:hypothetical protein
MPRLMMMSVAEKGFVVRVSPCHEGTGTQSSDHKTDPGTKSPSSIVALVVVIIHTAVFITIDASRCFASIPSWSCSYLLPPHDWRTIKNGCHISGDDLFIFPFLDANNKNNSNEIMRRVGSSNISSLAV